MEDIVTALDSLFEPRSIVLVGASSDPAKFGGRPLALLRRHGFRGDIYVVNPNFPAVDGINAVPTIEDLPDGIDLASILLPAGSATDALERCLARGVKSAMVVAGGFAEADPQGGDAQRRLADIARTAGIRLLGPNTPGFLNVHARTACSASGFLVTASDLEPGNVSIVAQSGAVAGVVASRLIARGVGLDLVVCSGNEADVTTAEVVRHIVALGRSTAIGLYLEALHEPDLVAAIDEARQQGIGIVLLTAGRSDAGREVVASHTGQLVGSHSTADAAARSLGLVRADDYDDLVEGLVMVRRPSASSAKGVAIVGASGGMNALLVDHLAEHGIQLGTVSQATKEALAELTPGFGRVTNPIDVSSDVLTAPERLGAIVSVLAADEGLGDVIVTVSDHPSPLAADIARTLADGTAGAAPPLVQWSAGPASFVSIAECTAAGLTVFTEPSRCARLLAQRREARPWGDATLSDIERPSVSISERPTEFEAKQFLAAHGIGTPRSEVVHHPTELAAAIDRLGGFAVVKANGRGAVHKSDIGAVVVGVRPADAEDVGRSVLDAATGAWGDDGLDGLLVEELVEPIAEALVSLVWHPGGLVTVTVASGGALVELFDDAVSMLAPASVPEVLDALRELRTWKMMEGFRGRPRGDVEALAELIHKLSQLGRLPALGLQLVELNPVAVCEHRAVALDAVIEVVPNGGGPC